MPPLYVIAGPTASGKTAVAVELAKLINGEVVSADSMQVYKGMDIGTAKPSLAEMEGIPHHLIDVIMPDESFSVAEYQKLANAAIQDIRARKKVPILAGGTGFYINAVIYETEFSQGSSAAEDALRQQYTAIAQEKGADFLHEKLCQIDPAAAKAIHPNNIKRVARALSYCETTGQLFSAHNAREKSKHLPLPNTIIYTLNHSRETLYHRINARTIMMWKAGLPNEVRKLLLQGYHLGLAAMQGIGYKETIKFLNAEFTEKEVIAAIQQSTRHYAKRQETWFRHQSPDARPIFAEGKTAHALACGILKGV